MLTIHVASPTPSCVAIDALLTEGVSGFELHHLTTETAYAELINELPRPFILVEHDIVPWPGAIAMLILCDREYCAYPYPLGPGHDMTASLGCVKLPEWLPEIPPSTPWYEVDIAVTDALAPAAPHLHSPPVGHVHPA